MRTARRTSRQSFFCSSCSGTRYALADRPNLENLRRAERLNFQVLETYGRTAPASIELEPTLGPTDGIAAAVALTEIQNGHDTGVQRLVLAVLSALGVISGLIAIVYATKARRLPGTPVPLLEVLAGCLVIAWSAFFVAAVAADMSGV
jgi:hypothetical protein